MKYKNFILHERNLHVYSLFLYIFFKEFLYFFMAALSLNCCAQSFSSFSKCRLLSIAVSYLLMPVPSLAKQKL